MKRLLLCFVENTNEVASDVNNNNRFCFLTDVHSKNVVPDVKKKKENNGGEPLTMLLLM